MESARQLVSTQVVVGFPEQRLSYLAEGILRACAHYCAVVEAAHFRLVGLVRFSDVVAKSEISNRILSDLMAPPPLAEVAATESVHVVQQLFERNGGQEIAVVTGPERAFVGLITPASFSAWLRENERVRQAQVERLLDEQKRLGDFLERKVSTQLAEVRGALDEFGRMCVSLSHDIRQPLRSIRGFAEQLANGDGGQLNPEGRDAAERIIRVVLKTESLAESLLGQARISFGDKSAKLATIDLNVVLADALEFIDAEIRRTGAQVRARCTLGKVTGYYVPVLQVFVNLILNALKHVAAGRYPQVEVWTEEKAQSGEVILYMRDNGRGMSEEHFTALSAPLHAQYGAAPQGAGFGLTITRNALEALGGRMQIASSGTDGTLFVLNLPKAEEKTRTVPVLK